MPEPNSDRQNSTREVGEDEHKYGGDRREQEDAPQYVAHPALRSSSQCEEDFTGVSATAGSRGLLAVAPQFDPDQTFD